MVQHAYSVYDHNTDAFGLESPNSNLSFGGGSFVTHHGTSVLCLERQLPWSRIPWNGRDIMSDLEASMCSTEESFNRVERCRQDVSAASRQLGKRTKIRNKKRSNKKNKIKTRIVGEYDLVDGYHLPWVFSRSTVDRRPVHLSNSV